MSNIDHLISQLQRVVEGKTGFSKKANLGEMKTEPVDGVPAEQTQESGAKEMSEDSCHETWPTEECYDKGVSSDYTIEEEKMREALQNGEQNFAESSHEKTAKMANKILSYYNSKLNTSKKKDNLDKSAEMTKSAAFQAGEKAFKEIVEKHGHKGIVKSAEEINKTMYLSGAQLADLALTKIAEDNKQWMEKGAELADLAVNEFIKQAEAARNIGAKIAENLIEKLAADLSVVKPVLQDMVAKGLITSQEQDALISALGAADTINPESVSSAVQGMSNADVVAESILKALEGPQGENIPPEPMQSVSAPATSPAQANVSAPEAGTGEVKPEYTPEEEIVIEAAYKLLNKKASKGKRK